MDQESLKEEVKEEMENIPVSPMADASSYEDIPDWLRNTSPVSILPTEASPENSEKTSEAVPSKKEKSEPKQKQTPSSKKTPKSPATKEEGSADLPQAKEEAVLSHPRKKKPVPVVSPGPVIPTTDEDLPDWLK